MAVVDVALVTTILSAIDSGAGKAELSSLSGLSPSELDQRLEMMQQKGLVEATAGSVVITRKGQEYYRRLVHSKGAMASSSAISEIGDSQEVDEKLDRLIASLPE